MTASVSSIEITRATGFTAACGDVRKARDWEGAAAALRDLAEAVDPGRFDECDFVVVFEDGLRYTNTFELRHPTDGRASFDLAGHVRSRCEDFLSDDPHWVRFRAKYDAEGSRAETMRSLLESYDLGTAARSPAP